MLGYKSRLVKILLLRVEAIFFYKIITIILRHFPPCRDGVGPERRGGADPCAEPGADEAETGGRAAEERSEAARQGATQGAGGLPEKTNRGEDSNTEKCRK